jgi:hypothetical protein
VSWWPGPRHGRPVWFYCQHLQKHIGGGANVRGLMLGFDILHTTQHNTTQHNTTQHNTTQHSTTQHNTTQHNTGSSTVQWLVLLAVEERCCAGAVHVGWMCRPQGAAAVKSSSWGSGQNSASIHCSLKQPVQIRQTGLILLLLLLWLLLTSSCTAVAQSCTDRTGQQQGKDG